MKRYNIRIDGSESVNSYTYQELVDMGLFELETNGIEIKQSSQTNFMPFASYCFSERQFIDEYGQIIRQNVSTNSSYSSLTSTNSNNQPSSNSDYLRLAWRVVVSIIVAVIAVCIAVGGVSNTGAFIIAVIGSVIYGIIWDSY